MKKWTVGFVASVCVVMMMAAPALAAEQARTHSQDRECVEDGSCSEDCVQTQTQVRTQTQTQTQVQLKSLECSQAAEPLRLSRSPWCRLTYVSSCGSPTETQRTPPSGRRRPRAHRRRSSSVRHSTWAVTEVDSPRYQSRRKGACYAGALLNAGRMPYENDILPASVDTHDLLHAVCCGYRTILVIGSSSISSAPAALRRGMRMLTVALSATVVIS